MGLRHINLSRDPSMANSCTSACRGQRRRGLDILVQPRRDRQAAFKLMRKLLKKQGITPTTIVTDKLRSYGSALRELGVAWRHDTGAGRITGQRIPISHCDNANDV